MKSIIFWGATGQAKVLREYIDRLGYQLMAVFDNDRTVRAPFPDVPLYYGREAFLAWRLACAGDTVACLVAIGGAHGRDRVELQAFLEQNGCTPIVAQHPTAFVAASAHLAPGCQILPQAAVCAEVRMGDCCIVNTAASVDHESVLGQGVHLAPGARLAGSVHVEDYTLIGIGAVVLPRLHIGHDVIVGAGAVVTRDVPDGAVVYGNPARIQQRSK